MMEPLHPPSGELAKPAPPSGPHGYRDPDDLPTIAYCVSLEAAAALIREVLRDAAGRPVGIDIETAPTQAEADRLQTLEFRQTAIKGEWKAAKRANAPPSELASLEVEKKLLAAQVKFAKTAALDPHRSRIRLVQLYGGGDRVAVIDVFKCGAGVLDLLDGVDVTAHNAAFELSHLEAIGVVLGEVHCTLQAARLTLGEAAMSLADVAQAHLGIELDKTEQTSNWSTPELTREQLQYAALDAVMAFRLAPRILPALGPQSPAYETQIGVTPAVVRMKHCGVLLDLDAHAVLMRTYADKRLEACESYGAACADMGLARLAANIPNKPADKRAVLTEILSSEELRRWARTAKKGELSTARSDLKRAVHYPPLRALVELSKIDKVLTAFGPTLRALVSPVTGRIHASYRVAAAASGRATCSYPNLQQAPREKEFRALFRAAEGNKLVGADFSSMELRAAAHISGDRRMTDVFRQGGDPHRLTASLMLGKPESEVTSEQRAAAKPCNFGMVYGLGPSGLIATAWDQYDIVLTAEDAERWINAVRRAYPELTRWRYDHYEECQRAGRIVIGKDARRGVGRFYPLSRLPKGARNGYTRCCNFPIQGSCADASMLALTAIDQALFEVGSDGAPVLWLHDEIVLEVPQADAERAKELLEQAMVDAFLATFPGAPVNGLVEAHIGLNWAEAKG
jgi:DNA polymerase I